MRYTFIYLNTRKNSEKSRGLPATNSSSSGMSCRLPESSDGKKFRIPSFRCRRSYRRRWTVGGFFNAITSPIKDFIYPVRNRNIIGSSIARHTRKSRVTSWYIRVFIAWLNTTCSSTDGRIPTIELPTVEYRIAPLLIVSWGRIVYRGRRFLKWLIFTMRVTGTFGSIRAIRFLKMREVLSNSIQVNFRTLRSIQIRYRGNIVQKTIQKEVQVARYFLFSIVKRSHRLYHAVSAVLSQTHCPQGKNMPTSRRRRVKPSLPLHCTSSILEKNKKQNFTFHPHNAEVLISSQQQVHTQCHAGKNKVTPTKYAQRTTTSCEHRSSTLCRNVSAELGRIPTRCGKLDYLTEWRFFLGRNSV